MPRADHSRGAPAFLVFGLLLVAGAVGVALFARSGPAAARAGSAPHQPERTTPAPAIASSATADAVLHVASTLLQQNDPKRAEAVLAAAVRQHPDDPQLRLALGRVLVRLERPQDAYAHYEAALATGATGPEVHFEAGTVANMAERRDRAIEHYAAAQAADPSDARFPLYLAQVQRAAGDRAAAKKNLLLAATLDDAQPIAWGTLADMELEDNRPGVALQHVAKARALEPRAAIWRVIEARALKRQNEPGRALMVLEGIEGEERASLPVLRLVGECFALLGRPGDAAERFVQACERPGASAELCFETATWLERAGEPDRALRYAKIAAMQGHQPAQALTQRLTEPAGNPTATSPAEPPDPTRPDPG